MEPGVQGGRMESTLASIRSLGEPLARGSLQVEVRPVGAAIWSSAWEIPAGAGLAVTEPGVCDSIVSLSWSLLLT